MKFPPISQNEMLNEKNIMMSYWCHYNLYLYIETEFKLFFCSKDKALLF